VIGINIKYTALDGVFLTQRIVAAAVFGLSIVSEASAKHLLSHRQCTGKRVGQPNNSHQAGSNRQS
tara:strand:- start:4937 stop:5134 length:198 start_codon:yes stop_codon:yes gene_type:complete